MVKTDNLVLLDRGMAPRQFFYSFAEFFTIGKKCLSAFAIKNFWGLELIFNIILLENRKRI